MTCLLAQAVGPASAAEGTLSQGRSVVAVSVGSTPGVMSPTAVAAVPVKKKKRKPKRLPPPVITSTLTMGALPEVVLGHVAVYGLDLDDVVAVAWGDGATSTGEFSRCPARIAAKRPQSCLVQYWHPYPTPGTYAVDVTVNGSVVDTHTATVVALERGNPTTPPVDISDTGWRQQMLDAVNRVRAANGAAPLALCASLSQSAQKHSLDMAARDYYSHYSPEGVGYGTRIWREYGGMGGENIAGGFPDVTSVVDAWVASPGHFANMISPRHAHAGFGLATGGSAGTYWVQNFGSGGTC